MESIEKSVEHICQNCGAYLSGNYCINCGQKRTTIHDKSVKALLDHFFNEFFSWDSRFFRSIKYLFTKPGFLTHEYISGRVNSYVSPLKMFLFTSFVLFFIMIKSDPNQYKALVIDEPENNFLKGFILEEQSESKKSAELYIEEFDNQFNNNITLYIFGIMLIFSILLKIVYLSKNYFYAEHIVFTLHFFTFTLWCFLLGVIFQVGGDLSVLVFWYLVPGIYLFLAIKNVYHKTLWKAILTSMFMIFSYWVLLTGWVLGSICISAVRAA